MRRITIVSLVLVLGIAAAADKKSAGFRSLFNGKDLSGWHKNPAKIGHGTGGSWTVVNGAVVGAQDPPVNGGLMLSDEKFGNFEVQFDVWPDWGCDSGFFLRSNDKGQAYQIMIDYHDGGNVGEIYREGLDGQGFRSFQIDGVYSGKTLKDVQAKPEGGGQLNIDPAQWTKKIWKMNGWNTIRARVEGDPPTITTWINGHLITKYTSDRKFEDKIGDTGSLAMQVHGGEKAWAPGGKIRFRNIKIKELR